MKNELNIAVRSLAEHVLRSGDLSLEFIGAGRTVEAIRAHQKIQKSRPENYIAEVSVSRRVETDDFILTVSGRIDGVFCFPDAENPNRAIVEEIKTKTGKPDYFESDEFERNENPVHWGQAKLYAFIYAEDLGLSEIGVRLTYHHLDTGRSREFNRDFTFEELAAFFEDIVGQYLDWAKIIADWIRLRDESIMDLAFPFDEYRPGQRRLAEEAYRTIRDGRRLVVQAATGIGKTMAAMFPAIKAVAMGLNSKIFYLTARTTGRIAAEKAADMMRTGGLRFKSVSLTAKDKICFNPGSACNAEECEFAKGYYDRIGGAVEDIFKEDSLARDTIERIAKHHAVCPFEFSLELTVWADCVICDYNYAFDPGAYLRRFFTDETGDYTFLVDEAHNLADRSRDMFSADFQKDSILKTRRAIKKGLPGIYKSLGKINTWMVDARKRCRKAGGTIVEKSPPDDLFPLLSNFLRTTERWLAKNIKTDFRKTLLDFYFQINSFMRVADIYDKTYAVCYTPNGGDLVVRLFCIDPSDQLDQALKRCRAAVFFSATMTPADYFKKILGCENAGSLVLPSPFPTENLGIYIADRISTYYRDREKTADEVRRAVVSMARGKKGNYLVFFPSYAYLQMVYSSVTPEELPDTRIVVQTPGMTETERESFLGLFEKENPETLIGFAVMGGVFGEGIDLAGDRLSGAAIVGVGLPGISPERDLIREYFDECGGTGFEFAYVYPGINRVFQAAGRVIRSETDRGVVLLIDKRFSTFRYKSLLPSWWRPARMPGDADFRKDLERFWLAGN